MLATVAAALAVGPAAVAGSTLPPGAILFQSGRTVDGGLRLYVTGARDDRLRDPRVVVSYGEQHWSPDGREFAYGRQLDDGAFEYVRARANGTGRALIVRTRAGGPTGQFTWSPDGRRIAFTHAVRPDQSGIAVVDVNGRGLHDVTSPQAAEDDVRPAWSRNGRWIAFVRYHREGCGPPQGDCGGVYLVDPSGKRLRRLTTNRSAYVTAGPSWSPDSTRLAFGVGTDVYVVNVNGGKPRRISQLGPYLSWSPNGKWIAITGSEGTVRVRPDGGGQRRISKSGSGAPSWSPDSRAVAVEDNCCAPDVLVIRADGSGERELTQGSRFGYANYGPEWNPRGLGPSVRIGGRIVLPGNPTDSQIDGRTLRTTSAVTRLAADGSRAAMAYATGKIELWDEAAKSVTRLGLLYSTNLGRGFGLAGDRVATTWIDPAMGIDTWFVEWATLELPRRMSTGTTLQGWPGPCCSTPLEHVAGDGDLLVVDGWGPCRISQAQPCATEPKKNGALYRITGSGVTELASDAGALTLMAVDRDRILVDRENGTLQLFRGDGTPLHAVTYGPAGLLGAGLGGSDLVVLTTEGLADYDSATGGLRHVWPAPAGARLADVASGLAVYLVGNEIHVLRLGDGKEKVIRPASTGPVLAQLEETGLIYSFTVDDPRYPGRVEFVPLSALMI